jgi:hypothetical protein
MTRSLIRVLIRPLLLTAAIAGAIVVGGAPSTTSALDNTPWRLPSAPPRCTSAEARSGDVGHCLVAFYDDPAATGWGQPPAPGVGDGWSFTGSRYNDSPALAAWETERITSNTEPVGGLSTGRLETHVDAHLLFEGFLSEISAKGYEVRDASGYSFRCTSGNGGWSCPSGDPDDLSNHAWGLAVDMNSGTNPIRNYSSQNGQTACMTPVETDLPRWAIQVAEKWGLYWGGYGWNSGCPSTSTERSSVYRDPPHFEFRGTPQMARAIAEFNLGNDPDRTCFTVIDDDGEPQERCNSSGRPDARWRLPIVTDPPPGATAVMVNLTATDSTGPGFLTLEDCGPQASDRTTSALTFAAGDSVAAMAVTPIADDGRFCVYRSTAVHSVVDVLGFIGVEGEPLWFDPTVPDRLTDTREDGACSELEECHDGPVADRSIHVVPTADVRPLIANIAVVDGQGPGWVQAGACDGIGGDALFSNLNYQDATARSNLALIDGAGAGSCVYVLREAHVLVDELGALDADEGYGWSLTAPERELDTRECSPSWCDGRPGQRTVIELDLATEAPAAAIAITVTEPQGPGFVSVGSCDVLSGDDAIETSNLNHGTGQTVTNLAVVDLDEGKFCIFLLESTHVVIDVQAEFTTDHETGLLPVEPDRVHDSREL